MKRIVICSSLLIGVLSCGDSSHIDEEKRGVKEVNTTDKVSDIIINNELAHEDSIAIMDSLPPKKEESVIKQITPTNEAIALDSKTEPLIISEGDGLISDPNEIQSDQSGNSNPSIGDQDMVITFNHNKFNELLQKHVSSEGIVNYASFKKEEGKLNSYLAMLQDAEPKESWSSNKKLAYYINLYNASTISLILSNYPLKSIMDIEKAWDQPVVKIGDKIITLNDLENKIIRPRFKEPRIHFAVNCAAVSCPKLSNQAFSEKNIENLLQENTEKFISNSSIGFIQNGEEVNVSQIFEWYAVDFGGKENVVQWISKNSSKDLKNVKLKGFIEYNWSLNDK